MSRLYDRIQEQKKIVEDKQEELDIAQSTLEALEYKARKYSSKKTRKAHRKKLLKDPTYAVLCKLQRELFKPVEVLGNLEAVEIFPDLEFRGTTAQLELGTVLKVEEWKDYEDGFFTKFFKRFKK